MSPAHPILMTSPARSARAAAPDKVSLLQIRGLKTHFKTDDGWLHAVDGVDLTIERGETVCVVGESGCGKTVTAMTVLKLLPMPPGRIVAGTIDVAAAIIAESTLSFLGLGFPPDIPTWGRILFDAKDTLDTAPHWALFPGTAIFLTVLSINFVGDGLRDALDPRRVVA